MLGEHDQEVKNFHYNGYHMVTHICLLTYSVHINVYNVTKLLNFKIFSFNLAVKGIYRAYKSTV